MINRNVRLFHTGLLFYIIGLLHERDWMGFFFGFVGCAFTAAWVWVDRKGGDDA